MGKILGFDKAFFDEFLEEVICLSERDIEAVRENSLANARIALYVLN
jgi:hypothetical protein